MLTTALKAIFGSRNDRLLKQYRKSVEQINALEPAMREAFRRAARRQDSGAEARSVADGATLDSILPEAFAVVREASKRVLGMRHFDVQLVGGIALHQGKIAEMRTGEGKTLVATLPSYLNALSGNGVHIVTVNDYLARATRNGWGASIASSASPWAWSCRRWTRARSSSPTRPTSPTAPTTNSASTTCATTWRPPSASASSAGSTSRSSTRSTRSSSTRRARRSSSRARPRIPRSSTGAINGLIPQLVAQADEKGEGDYWVDLKQHTVMLSEQGHEHAEEIMTRGGAAPRGREPLRSVEHHADAPPVRRPPAHALYHRDQHYVVQDDEVVIVDEFTGRMMQGRRWSDGLHQAVEAKEGVSIKNESQTLATITFQNYFRLYKKLSGMTGTADTEAFEFSHDLQPRDGAHPDAPADGARGPERPGLHHGEGKVPGDPERREGAKRQAASRSCSARRRWRTPSCCPAMLQREKIPHNVLNAKQHAREAEIVTQAGRPSQVTIATNMAGRGTDIVLGGNPDPEINQLKDDAALAASEKERRVAEVRESWQKLHDDVVAAGGLHIVGSERHESRRIDNQLRGRSGRQGDPGSSRFYLSFEDPLLKIFAGERLQSIMRSLKIPEGEAIEARMVTRSIENAQRKVEARNFDIRKQLLEYDDVANDQRKVIYQQRNELLESSDISDTIASIRRDVLAATVKEFIPPESVEEQWDVPGLERKLEADFFIKAPVAEWAAADRELDGDRRSRRSVARARGARIRSEVRAHRRRGRRCTTTSAP